MMVQTRRTAATTGLFAVLLVSSITGPTLGADLAPGEGSFSPAGSLTQARTEHTATILPDGAVLVIGGYGEEGTLASAELWDPASDSFSPAGSLGEARAAHTATLLQGGGVLVVGGDGGVLVIGGYGDEGTLASAELWDPATKSFSQAGSLVEARNGHTATLLQGGGVLVVGGLTNDGNNLRASVELWEPDTRTFVPMGSLVEARAGHTATLLPSGGVLVIGGLTNDDVFRATAEIWSPVTGSFNPAGSLGEARAAHTATLLPDGVLVVGGYGDDGALSSAELWDQASFSFSPTGPLAETRGVHTATLLPDGRALVVGGVDLIDLRASAELWDPASGSFSPAGSLAEARAWHTGTALPGGGVLVVGGVGEDGSPTTSAELWASDASESTPPGASDELDVFLEAVALMNMLPPGIMETCLPGSPSLDGQRAVVQCQLGDDTVVYASFDDAESLAAAYDGIAAAASVEDGRSCGEGAFEGPYIGADGAEAGRVVCQLGDTGPLLGWTDIRNLLLGFVALSGEGGFPVLHEHWLKVRLDAVTVDGASPATGSEVRQRAVGALASSQYTATDWSAEQATGSPDAPAYGQYPTSWAPLVDPGDPEWIELTYAVSVVPTAIHIWEANGAGFVVQVEAWDAASGEWRILWQGTDPTPEQLMAFSPPLTATEIPTQRIRVTAGEGAAGWPYVDAVELVGTTIQEILGEDRGD